MTKVLSARECACGTKFVPKSAKHKHCSAECRKGKKAVEAAPPLEYTLIDVSNHLLATGPSALSCGFTETEAGDTCLLMTVRTSSTTCTVALTYKEASAWLGEFAIKVKKMQDDLAAAA
jgi:hypothetical protein